MKVVLIVMDSAGIGDAPDSLNFGDRGANTVAHALEAAGGRDLPHLAGMGLSHLVPLSGTHEVPLAGVAFPVHPSANGKDTLAGHWEMMGLTVTHPFRTYPAGFPDEVRDALEQAFGRPTLGNEAASGTEIMARLGALHMETGYPILYTSADSVLQLAAHESVVPIELLYQWCQEARRIMQTPHLVGRIIARPFVGQPGSFVRTANRHDYAVEPWAPTMVDHLADRGVKTIAVGKIGDIFSLHGFSRHSGTRSNADGLQKTLAALSESDGDTFIYTNLVEFDSHYGHRRDAVGYADALSALDGFLPHLWDAMDDDDQLWITADHGCDPTYPGSDHTRETVPWLCYGPSLGPFVGGARESLADLGATLACLFGAEQMADGTPAGILLETRR